MSDFPLPKTPGGKNFGTIDRFRTPKPRSPGPLAYEPEASLNFSVSMMSRSSSTPNFSFRENFAVPGSARKAAEAAQRGMVALRVPPGLGEQQSSSRLSTSPSFSMPSKRLVQATPRIVTTPSPLSYTLPRARVYETRSDRSLGTDDRFGADAPSSSLLHVRNALPIPGPSEYDSSDLPTRTASLSYTIRARRKMPRTRDDTPSPHDVGDGYLTKTKLLPERPAYSMGIKKSDAGTARSMRVPLEPAPGSYDARSLYWSGKSQLGRSGTAPGTVRSPMGLSVHKDVQASQPGLHGVHDHFPMPRIGPVGRF